MTTESSRLLIPVDKDCIICGRTNRTIVDSVKYSEWRSGKLIQDVFPEMTAEDREMMISGLCPGCWNKVWGEE